MTDDLSKKILLIIGLATVVYEADAAATARATVTANIVPISSLSISESFHQNITPEKNNDVQQILINNHRIKISSYHNNTYDLSISSQSTLTDPDPSNRIKMDPLEIHNDTPSQNGNNRQRLIIEGVLTKPDSKNTSPYSDATEITVNYN